jgi:hypothetical protein
MREVTPNSVNFTAPPRPDRHDHRRRSQSHHEAAVSPGMLDGNHHQRLDQRLEHDFAGYSLRHLDDRGEIELLDRRLDGRLRGQWCLLSGSGAKLVRRKTWLGGRAQLRLAASQVCYPRAMLNWQRHLQ